LSGLDQTKLRERVLATTASVTEWACARVSIGSKSDMGAIGEFYSDYALFCRDRKASALPRKAWLQAVKFAGFRVDSSQFAALKLKNVQTSHSFATITRIRSAPAREAAPRQKD
jgi:hypothetical protein